MTICGSCQEPFEPKDHYKKQKYCSYKCARFARRVIEWPDKETLYNLIHSKSITAIGKEYGVSAFTVQRWINHHDLEVPRPEPIKKIIICKYCLNKFLRKARNQKYCSKDCVDNARRFIDPPNKRELEVLLLRMNGKEIAKKYGVTPTRIYNLIKEYDLSKISTKKVMTRK